MIAEKTVSKETFARALVIARSANVTSAIQSATTAKTGRPRINPWEAFFVLLAITALEGSGSLILTRAAAVAARLSEDQRREINMVGTMTYRQIESRLADLAAGFHERVNTKTGEVFGPRLDLGLHDFMSRIAAGLIPSAIPDHRHPVHRLHRLRDALQPTVMGQGQEARCPLRRAARDRLRTRGAPGQEQSGVAARRGRRQAATHLRPGPA